MRSSSTSLKTCCRHESWSPFSRKGSFFFFHLSQEERRCLRVHCNFFSVEFKQMVFFPGRQCNVSLDSILSQSSTPLPSRQSLNSALFFVHIHTLAGEPAAERIGDCDISGPLIQASSPLALLVQPLPQSCNALCFRSGVFLRLVSCTKYTPEDS